MWWLLKRLPRHLTVDILLYCELDRTETEYILAMSVGFTYDHARRICNKHLEPFQINTFNEYGPLWADWLGQFRYSNIREEMMIDDPLNIGEGYPSKVAKLLRQAWHIRNYAIDYEEALNYKCEKIIVIGIYVYGVYNVHNDRFVQINSSSPPVIDYWSDSDRPVLNEYMDHEMLVPYIYPSEDEDEPEYRVYDDDHDLNITMTP